MPSTADGGLKMTCKTIAYYSPIHYPAFIGGQERRELRGLISAKKPLEWEGRRSGRRTFLKVLPPPPVPQSLPP